MTKGFFLCLEGIDGSGKTTARAFIEEWFKLLNIPVVITREPGGTPYAEDIRRIILNPPAGEKISPMTETLLFMAAREQHIEGVIKPKLEQGYVVVSDRFCDSTFCYQGAGRQMDINSLRHMHEYTFGKFYPDLTIVMDGSPVEFKARIDARSEDANHFDNNELSFHERSREIYLKFAKDYPGRYAVVNASVSIDQVNAQLICILQNIESEIRKRPEYQ